MEKLTEEQIFKYKKELEYFYAQRKKLLILALVLLGVAVTCLIIVFACISANSETFLAAMLTIYPMVFCFIGAIVVFILRGALYNTRINNRKIALEYSEIEKNKKEE